MEIGLALEIVDGGFMDQVTVTNLTMEGILTPLFIRLGIRRSMNKDADGNPIPGTLKNVVISNISATDESFLHSSVTGIPGSYVENVIIRDVILHSKGGGSMQEANREIPEKIDRYPQANVLFGYSIPAYGMYVRHVKSLVMENFSFNLLKPAARLEGSGCADIKLFVNNFSRVDKIVDFRDGSQKSAVKMLSNFE